MDVADAGRKGGVGKLRRPIVPNRVSTLLARMDRTGRDPCGAAAEPLPVTIPKIDSATVGLLSGDDYGPAVAGYLAGASRSVEIAYYSIAAKWPKGRAEPLNLLRLLAEMPARGITCTAVLAAHHKHGSTPGFNRVAGRILAGAGWRLRWAKPSRLLHAKFICIDGRTVITGSHNLSWSAISSNIDLSVVIEAPQTAAPFLDWFARLYSASTKKAH